MFDHSSSTDESLGLIAVVEVHGKGFNYISITIEGFWLILDSQDTMFALVALLDINLETHLDVKADYSWLKITRKSF